MPFLRRRGMLASETDMRRHSGIDQGQFSATGSLPNKQPAPRKSIADDLFNPESSLTPDAANASNRLSEDVAEGGSMIEVGTLGASLSGANPASASAGRPSEDPYDRPDSPPVQEETPKHRRFSMLRFRNASDSQLSARLKQQQHQQQHVEKLPPMPKPPAIITTAPTIDRTAPPKKSRMRLPLRMRRSGEMLRQDQDAQLPLVPETTLGSLAVTGSASASRSEIETSERKISPAEGESLAVTARPGSRPGSRPHTSGSHRANEPNSHDGDLVLALPSNRQSESERSEGSSGNRSNFVETPPKHTAATGSSGFFRLPRRKPRQPEPLFPMAHLPQRSKPPGLQPTASSSSLAPRNSTSTGPTNGGLQDLSRSSTGVDHGPSMSSHDDSGPNRTAESPATALFRSGSRNSGQASPTRSRLNLRGRSSTMSSLGANSIDEHQLPGTTRTSSSTGRKSFGDLLGLGRLRPNTDMSRHGALTPATPGSNTSKNNSLQLTRERESVVLPERREDDTPAKYLARLEEMLNRGVIASALSKGSDPFSAAVLRSYMRSFGFFEEPMDMAIRKLLMEADLPKETQHIDRFLQSFANRYHECNPGIYSSPEQAYFIAFSLLILHTDVFNKNNKHKMQKPDYLKNTREEGISDDVLECFYDNITYTPFIHVEDALEMNGTTSKKKTIFANGTPESLKRSKDPIDPYTIILDGRMDTLRPPLKDQIPLDEHFSYLGTSKALNLRELQKAFFRTAVVQIISARSRPDAFMSEKTVANPQEAQPGIIQIKVTKVGLVWRKDPKKKKTRSPWQEWGAILTSAQLYFFRNTTWVKGLMHQYDMHLRQGHDGIPLIFKPPVEEFKPDVMISTDGLVALWDMAYRKHKNAFMYVRHGGLDEVLLAQSEEDRNDWLAKINYAGAFRSSGVRIRGPLGGAYEGQSRRAIRRLDSDETGQIVQTPSGEVSIHRSRIDQKLAQDILEARREAILRRIKEIDERLLAAQKHLEMQLRNARHLLVLAPIQDKSREQVRGGAAKIIAQLKWSRIEMWRLRCYRDILGLDLEEDQDPASGKTPSKHSEAKAGSSTAQEDDGEGEGADEEGESLKQRQSTRSVKPLKLPASTGPLHLQLFDGESPLTDVFQTPPTSATAATFQKPKSPQQSVGHETGARKTSVSSMASSIAPDAPSPSRKPSSPGSGQERNVFDEHDEDDADERQVLEQAGLLEVEISRTPDKRPVSRSLGQSEDSKDRDKDRDKDKVDKSKIRRSLQRTLREGAGHLSHHRSRKGKDSASGSAMSDEMVRDANAMLSRGSGSFTVHGKKASVINFGSELQHLSQEERLRAARKHSTTTEDGMLSPASLDDFQSLMDEPLEREQERERRESAASASTATARSFRELHRKYSTAQHAKSGAPLPGGAGGLTVAGGDEDSDAAVSFSDGRRSPLPPVEDGSDDEATQPHVVTTPPRQAEFYTPEPPGSPVEQPDEDATAEDGGNDAGGIEEEEEADDDEEDEDDDGKSPKTADCMPKPRASAVGA